MTEAQYRDPRDRGAWERDMESRAVSLNQRRAEQERGVLLRAEIAVEHLTGNEDFDFFLSLIQASLELARGRLALLKEDDERRLNFDPNELATSKACRQIEQGKIAELEAIMGLPALIRRLGKEVAARAYPTKEKELLRPSSGTGSADSA